MNMVKSESEKVQLSFEHTGFVWLDFHHAIEKLTFKNAKDVLQKAHDFLEKSGLVKD